MDNLLNRRGYNFTTGTAIPRVEENVYSFSGIYISKALWLYVAPVIFVVGSLGNLVCLIVLQTKSFRGTSHALLLSALAVCDLGVLCTGFMREILSRNLGYDIRLKSTTICKTHYFLTYLFPQLSSWTLVLVTMERLLSLWVPLHIKVIVTRRRVIFGWLLMIFILGLLNIHWLVIAELGDRGTGDNISNISNVECLFSPSQEHLYIVFTWIDWAVLSFIPILIIIPCNGCIIKKVCIAKSTKRISCHQNRKRSKNARSVTVMLLVVSFVFILCTTPVTIYFAGYRTWPQDTWEDYAKTYFAFTICNLLYFLNSAINFFLYCICGSHFREAVRAMFNCHPSSTMTYRSRTGSFNHSAWTPLIGIKASLAKNGSTSPFQLYRAGARHHKFGCEQRRGSLDGNDNMGHCLNVVQDMHKTHSDSYICLGTRTNESCL